MASPHPDEVALESKVAFLRQTTSFAEPTYRVEAIETHMSWVFLTDGYAYKLKKPVYYSFLDFRTIEARRHYCAEEVRLNRRLAGSVYLGVVSMTINPAGHLQLDGHGKEIDSLVKMRRLPAHHMLDFAIRNGTASAEDMISVATLLAGFYRALQPDAMDLTTYRKRFLDNIDQNLQTLSSPPYQLPIGQVERICAGQRAVLQHRSDWFEQRTHASRIVEGHGDLRPEHICLRPELAIIDCLEFSFQLRLADTADELAFLALECERLGAAGFGALLLKTYEELSGDRPEPALVHFYQSYRAALRAVIAIRHLDEEKFRYSAEWPRRALEYLQLSAQHLQRCESASAA